MERLEGQVLQLPLELLHAQAVGERSVDGARLERAPLALRARQLACVAQRDQLLGEPRQHQARVADDREQHLAQRFGLTRVQAERRRPVTGQSQSAQAQQCRGDLGRGPADDAGGLIGREGGPREQRSCEQRVRELGAFGEGAHDLGSFRGARQIGRCECVGPLERRACAVDGVADLGRAQLTGFHG